MKEICKFSIEIDEAELSEIKDISYIMEILRSMSN